LIQAINSGIVSPEVKPYLEKLREKCNRLLEPDWSENVNQNQKEKGSDKDDAQKSAEDA
jgi:hypothetical protein